MIAAFDHEPPARRRVLQLLTWTWCLPTTLVGLLAGVITVHLLSGRASCFRGSTVVRSPRLRGLGGVCLGPVILVTDHADSELIAHEWGHFRQHLLLGPLYLLVIGLPSATHAVWHRLRGGQFPEYYHFWTEAWADALGGVYDRHAHLHARWTGYAVGPFALVVATILTLLGFGHIVNFPFTDADALVDVAWARFGLAQQLLVPLTGGLGGDNANFWRPAAMVQFWALRQVFGEQPAGWHAWSLVLHIGNAVLVALFVEAVCRLVPAPGREDRPWALPLLTAALFAAHPLAEEIVPATARSLDLLLGIGFFGAMVCFLRALASDRAGVRAPIATGLFWLFAVLALASKEAGALLLPTCAVWAWRYGTRASYWRLVPFAVFAIGFLLVRGRVIEGVGGYSELGAASIANGLAYALERAFFEPFVSSVTTLFVPFAGFGFLLVVPLWFVIVRTLWAERERLVALAVVYVPWVLLLGLTHTYSRRVIYVPTVVMCVVFGMLTLRAIQKPGARLLVVALGLAYIYGSPVYSRYYDWEVAGRAASPYLDAELWQGIPAGSTVWLVDRPSRIDDDVRRYRLWSNRNSLNNAATTYSIEAWVDEHVADLELKSLTSMVLEAPLSDWRADVSVDGSDLLVRRRGARKVERGPAVLVEGEVARFTGEDIWLIVWNPEEAERVSLSGGVQ